MKEEERKEREELSKRSNSLRLELKAWEKEFASANNGLKASRDDIKKNPEIAQKYKEYNKTRDILSGKISREPPARQKSRKREHEATQEPAKRLRVMKTPSKSSTKPWEVDPYESPSVTRNLFTPSKKTAIGPTPQKDGQVLGIFDLLQEDGITPLKNETVVETKQAIQATPRKSTIEASRSLKHSRTPASSGKRYMLDMFATPLKSLNPNDQGGNTPSSVSKLHFATPSFLRRDSHRPLMPVVDENVSLELSPQMVRVPRKPLVRGLSSMLAGLRKLEEDAADEDLEALHEMENEMADESQPRPKVTISALEAILVKDSQPRLPLGGFDDEAMFDSEPDEIKNPTLGRDGQPLKIYKKKGQKRTTRKVNIKPVRSKPKPHPETKDEEDSEDELGPDVEAVPETHIDDDMSSFAEARNFDSDSQSEYTASEGGTRYRRPDQSKKAKRITKDGKIKQVAKKVTAVAHQNFKRLKLRNSGAKGGVAHNSRFRRKR